MNYLLLLTILTLIKSQAAVSSESEPDMVVEIFRHGARAPSDLKYDNSWPVHGELTSVGMRQLYVLGVAIARKYPNLLKEYNPKEIFIRSSNFNRTIMSASVHLYGVFQGKGPTIPLGSDIDLISPPFEDQELIDEINAGLENVPESVASGFQPLVIQVVNKPDDRVIFVGPWNCDKVAVWQEARFKDRLNQEVYEYFQGTIAQLKSLGYEVNSMMDLFIFGDTLIDNHADMRPLPNGIEYGSTLYNDSVFAFKWFSTYNFVGTGTERVIKSLTLLNQIVEWFKGVVNKTNPLKFAFLSAHDTTLLPLLGLYSLTNASCLFENYKSEKLGKPVPYPECVYPEFASQMIYELYNKPEGPYIKVLFNGKPIKICNKDKFECNLNEFVEQTRNVLMGYLPQDYVKLCDVSGPKEVNNDIPTNERPNFWYVFIIIALLCVVGGLVYLLVMQKKQLQTQEESNGCYKAEDQEMKEIILIRKTSGV